MANIDFPPFPWSVQWSERPGGNGASFAYLVDATGKKIAAIWAKPEARQAVAEFIAERCNK